MRALGSFVASVARYLALAETARPWHLYEDEGMPQAAPRKRAGGKRHWDEAFRRAVVLGLAKKRKSQHSSAVSDLSGVCGGLRSRWDRAYL